MKNVPPPPRKLQIILQGSPEHLECILYMGCDLTDRDAGVCGNLGISLAFETAGDEYVLGLLRHAPYASPEKVLHFGGKNPVRIETLQRSDFVHLHPVAELMEFHLDGCPDAAGLEMIKASVDDDAESVGLPVVSICFVLFLPEPDKTLVDNVFSRMGVMDVGIGYAHKDRTAFREKPSELLLAEFSSSVVSQILHHSEPVLYVIVFIFGYFRQLISNSRSCCSRYGQ